MTNKCPACGSSRIYPSRVRSLVERLRRVMSDRQPYRCHACGHRAWYRVDVPIAPGGDDQPDIRHASSGRRTITADDLDRLDTH